MRVVSALRNNLTYLAQNDNTLEIYNVILIIYTILFTNYEKFRGLVFFLRHKHNAKSK